MLKWAVADLSILGLDLTHIRVQLDVDGKHTSDCWGIVYDDTEIWVSPKLKGAELYRVLLHEIGHTFGLKHLPNGIMAPKRLVAADYQSKPPTHTQRREWAHEVAALVLEHRRKQVGKRVRYV